MKTRREFLRDGASLSASFLLPGQMSSSQLQAEKVGGASSRPNIIMILADDMGFSDIGCYGSEIQTPNLDKMAAGGMRFTQFYNNPRCCPSRACLLTGVYPHQAGMGMMADDYGRYPDPSYAGDLSPKCVTIAEALRRGGYSTAMAGKWHLTPPTGVDNHNWPLQRGFDKYFGTIAGACSYYAPATLTRDNTPIAVPKDFYYTDAIAENVVNYVDTFAGKDAPFFVYAAFTSPHWPLHALEEDIAQYKDRYRNGWDQLRKERHDRQIHMGIVDEQWALTERDPRVPPWELASYKEWEVRRMAVYAAQISRLDKGIGRILTKVSQMGIAENTLILFMSDNGGNYEEIASPAPNTPQLPNIFIPDKTKDGRPLQRGNNPNLMPGPEDTYQSYGIPWGNCSNTPFRLYKHFAHEGGISTPLVAYWPSVIREGNALTHQIGHESDIMATCLDVAGVKYPEISKSGEKPPALVGKSLLPIFNGKPRASRGPIFWEHHGNCAMRDGRWKLVSQFPDYWELYDMEVDRTELHNIADQHLDRVRAMSAAYSEWATFVGVKPWPLPQTPPAQREQNMGSPDYLRDDRISPQHK